MSATWAVPCPFLGVRVTIMNHLNNQVAVQAHCGFTVDILRLRNLSHDSDLLVISSCQCNSASVQSGIGKSFRLQRFYWTDQVQIW